jgi:hypothetical protein
MREFIRNSLQINYVVGCAPLVILQSPDYRAKPGQLLSRVKCWAISALMRITRLQGKAPVWAPNRNAPLPVPLFTGCSEIHYRI